MFNLKLKGSSFSEATLSLVLLRAGDFNGLWPLSAELQLKLNTVQTDLFLDDLD